MEPRSKAPAYKAMFFYKSFEKNLLTIFSSTFYIGSKAFLLQSMKSLGPLNCGRVKCHYFIFWKVWSLHYRSHCKGPGIRKAADLHQGGEIFLHESPTMVVRINRAREDWEVFVIRVWFSFLFLFFFVKDWNQVEPALQQVAGLRRGGRIEKN